MKKSATEAHRMLSNTYGEAAISERTCREWFQRFKNSDFDVEDQHDIWWDQLGCLPDSIVYRTQGRQEGKREDAIASRERVSAEEDEPAGRPRRGKCVTLFGGVRGTPRNSSSCKQQQGRYTNYCCNPYGKAAPHQYNDLLDQSRFLRVTRRRKNFYVCSSPHLVL
ncbi:hypothetical protein TNCV_1271741 [Trichonephila clavipes]|nr:hypothetical protein TNCV_1271741 [Trichonephila clavipes]